MASQMHSFETVEDAIDYLTADIREGHVPLILPQEDGLYVASIYGERPLYESEPTPFFADFRSFKSNS